MKLGGYRRREQDDAQIDMTSMLDIVFIMLIFFIVTSSFIRESGVEVNRPVASNTTVQQGASLFITITSNNEVYIDKRLIDMERIQATLERQLLEQPNVSLIIRADAYAFNGTVVQVMDKAKGAGIEKILFATEKQP